MNRCAVHADRTVQYMQAGRSHEEDPMRALVSMMPGAGQSVIYTVVYIRFVFVYSRAILLNRGESSLT
jgi:hypothetical protein